jgi:hypothetical protein
MNPAARKPIGTRWDAKQVQRPFAGAPLRAAARDDANVTFDYPVKTGRPPRMR